MKKVEITLFEFHELEKDAQEDAIISHRHFLESIPLEDIEERQEYSDSEVIDSIEFNDYLFFANGEFADCTTFVGKHPKSGTSEFKLHGGIYNI